MKPRVHALIIPTFTVSIQSQMLDQENHFHRDIELVRPTTVTILFFNPVIEVKNVWLS